MGIISWLNGVSAGMILEIDFALGICLVMSFIVLLILDLIKCNRVDWLINLELLNKLAWGGNMRAVLYNGHK